MPANFPSSQSETYSTTAIFDCLFFAIIIVLQQVTLSLPLSLSLSLFLSLSLSLSASLFLSLSLYLTPKLLNEARLSLLHSLIPVFVHSLSISRPQSGLFSDVSGLFSDVSSLFPNITRVQSSRYQELLHEQDWQSWKFRSHCTITSILLFYLEYH